MKLLVLLVCIPALAFGQTIKGTEGVRPCSGKPAPLQVKISGCSKAPCALARGTDITAEVLFENVRRTNTLTAKSNFLEFASGITGDFPFPNDKKDACAHLSQGECPLAAGEDAIWNLSMPVLKIYPSGVSLDLTMFLTDDTGEATMCFQVEAITTN